MTKILEKKIMAKKQLTNEVETEVIAVTSERIAPLNETTDKLNSLSITDLVNTEKAIRVVCQRYENSIKNYDGSISQNTPTYKKFQLFNELHHKVLNKMEDKLIELI